MTCPSTSAVHTGFSDLECLAAKSRALFWFGSTEDVEVLSVASEDEDDDDDNFVPKEWVCHVCDQWNGPLAAVCA